MLPEQLLCSLVGVFFRCQALGFLWSQRHAAPVQIARRRRDQIQHPLRQRHMFVTAGMRSTRQRQFPIAKAEAIDGTARKTSSALCIQTWRSNAKHRLFGIAGLHDDAPTGIDDDCANATGGTPDSRARCRC